jgi:hypothetical protein
LLASFLVITETAMAKDGRDFGGFFSLTGMAEQGDQVTVTLNLQLFNYSGADIKGAVVSLYPSTPGVDAQGSFTPVKFWRSRRDVVLSQQFTVPRSEYEEWLGGDQPNLFIVYTDAAGQQWERTAQLTRRPVVPF